MKRDPFAPYAQTAVRDTSVRSATAGFVVDGVPPEQPHGHGQRLHTPGSIFGMRKLLVLGYLLLGVIVARVFYLQMIHGDQYRAQAEGNRIQTQVEKALRGVVYDLNGELLVKNIPDFRLVINGLDVNPRTEEDLNRVAGEIAAATGIAEDQISTTLYDSLKSGQALSVQENIDYDDALRMMIDIQHVPAADIEVHYGREYLGGESVGHILGYTGSITEEEYSELADSGYALNDTLGKTGLELSYENELRGQDGYKNVEVDFRGREQSVIADVDPFAGHNLHLTLDMQLQNALYQELKAFVDEHDLPGASAVALDPRDGSVRALVSYPSYDNNIFAHGINQQEYQALLDDKRNPLFHRAITGTYPSGSTFKPIVAAAALEEGVADRNTSFLSTGGITINNQYFYPDWKAGGHGQTNVIKAIAESVNTWFYYVGGGDNETFTGLGVDRIKLYGEKFGLAAPTGIDIPGEAAGFLPSREWKEEFKNEPWYLGNTYQLAIGQGDILVTPLQVAQYTATIANGGTAMTPHIVDYTTNQDGETVRTIGSGIQQEQVVSASTIQIVREGMRETVLNGSARSLQSLPVSAAGKTGTAQFGKPDATHSWFTAFAPYEQPEIALTVLVEEGGGSNDAAVPIAQSILTKYFTGNYAAEGDEPTNEEAADQEQPVNISIDPIE